MFTGQWYFTFFVTLPAVGMCVGVPCSVISLYLLMMLFGNLLCTHTRFCCHLALGLVLDYVYSKVVYTIWYWKYVCSQTHVQTNVVTA